MSAKLYVSDHALLRYCERVLGADLAEIRRLIHSEVLPYATKLGDGTFPVLGGRARAVVTNGTVTTILPPEPVKVTPRSTPAPNHRTLKGRPQEERWNQRAAYEHILGVAKEDEP